MVQIHTQTELIDGTWICWPPQSRASMFKQLHLFKVISELTSEDINVYVFPLSILYYIYSKYISDMISWSWQSHPILEYWPKICSSQGLLLVSPVLYSVTQKNMCKQSGLQVAWWLHRMLLTEHGTRTSNPMTMSQQFQSARRQHYTWLRHHCDAPTLIWSARIFKHMDIFDFASWTETQDMNQSQEVNDIQTQNGYSLTWT